VAMARHLVDGRRSATRLRYHLRLLPSLIAPGKRSHHTAFSHHAGARLPPYRPRLPPPRHLYQDRLR
jgi:hypothetical protein